MDAGEFLRKRRKKMGLTIRDVVMMTGDEIDKTTISRIERSERGVSLKAAYYFSQIYEMRMEDVAKKVLGPKAKIKKLKVKKKKKRGRRKSPSAKKK